MQLPRNTAALEWLKSCEGLLFCLTTQSAQDLQPYADLASQCIKKDCTEMPSLCLQLMEGLIHPDNDNHNDRVFLILLAFASSNAFYAEMWKCSHLMQNKFATFRAVVASELQKMLHAQTRQGTRSTRPEDVAYPFVVNWIHEMRMHALSM